MDHHGDRLGDAIELVKEAGSEEAKSPSVLLGMKTLAGHGYTPVSTERQARAERAMDVLVTLANSV